MIANNRKSTHIDGRYFASIAVKPSVSWVSQPAYLLFNNMGGKISANSGDAVENFLFRRISVLMQRFDASLVTQRFTALWLYRLIIVPFL